MVGVINKRVVILNIIDINMGDERHGYTTLNNPSIRRSQGFIMVYSITSEWKFNHLEVYRKEILRVKDMIDSEDMVSFVLVGNDCHLEYVRKVGRKQGEDLAREWKCPFIEASHETYYNVDKIFSETVIQIWKNSGK